MARPRKKKKIYLKDIADRRYSCEAWVERGAGSVALRTACGKSAVAEDTKAEPGVPARFCLDHMPVP